MAKSGGKGIGNLIFADIGVEEKSLHGAADNKLHQPLPRMGPDRHRGLNVPFSHCVCNNCECRMSDQDLMIIGFM